MKQNKGKTVLSVLEKGDRMWFLDGEHAHTDVSDEWTGVGKIGHKYEII